MQTSVGPVRHVFSVEEFDRMGEAAVFGPDDRVELIDGEIFEMSPIGNPHMAQVDLLNYVLSRRFSGRAIVRVQGHFGRATSPSPSPTSRSSDPGPTTTLPARRLPRTCSW